MKRLYFFPLTALVLLSISCKEERTPEMNGPHLLVVVSGDDQEGVIDTPLDEPIVIEAQNRFGEPISDISFTATVVSGGGTLGASAYSTGTDGLAEIVWTMGHEPYAAIELKDDNDIVTRIELDYNDQVTVTDPRGDGALYHVKKFCDHYWITENVRYATEASVESSSNPDEYYGRMYFPIEFSKICPIGWHIPTDKEFLKLEECLGLVDLGDSNQLRGTHGKDMKTTTDWADKLDGGNGTGNNSSAFNALPAGIYDGSTFKFVGKQASFWTATQDSTNSKYLARILTNESSAVRRVGVSQDTAMSCRCVKNY